MGHGLRPLRSPLCPGAWTVWISRFLTNRGGGGGVNGLSLDPPTLEPQKKLSSGMSIRIAPFGVWGWGRWGLAKRGHDHGLMSMACPWLTVTVWTWMVWTGRDGTGRMDATGGWGGARETYPPPVLLITLSSGGK